MSANPSLSSMPASPADEPPAAVIPPTHVFVQPRSVWNESLNPVVTEAAAEAT